MITPSASHAACSRLWDVCIIGTGALGIVMGLKLARAGRSVAILEASGEDITDSSQKFYECRSIGHPHVGGTSGRFRVFGGSTERWAGQAMRFDPIDFEPRDEIFPEGWPYRSEELDPYYSEAEAYMGVADANYDGFDTDFRAQASSEGLDAPLMDRVLDPFQLHYSVFTAQPRMREKYRSELAALPELELMINSPARRFISDEPGRICAVEIGNQEERQTIRAKTFILACGCVENTRFLLLQRDRHHLSLLEELPMLGRCLQDHPGCHLGELSLTKGAFIQDLFRLKPRAGISYKARISWNRKKRENDSLLAVSGTLLMMRGISDFDDCPPNPIAQAKALLDPRPWFRTLRLASQGIIFSPIHHTYLAVSAEDLRDRESKILLSTSKVDPNGDPLAEIDWRISPSVADSILEYVRCFEHLLASCGLGSFRRFCFLSDPSLLLEQLKDNSHQIGATSIGPDAGSGVVDRDLRVFGTENLHVVGTSVLPTGSHANPTLTALALGIRLASHLAR